MPGKYFNPNWEVALFGVKITGLKMNLYRVFLNSITVCWCRLQTCSTWRGWQAIRTVLPVQSVTHLLLDI